MADKTRSYEVDPDTQHWVIEKPTLDSLDYPFNWGPWLTANGGGNIVDAEFTVDPSLTVDNVSFDATTATVWLSGGKAPDKGPNELKVVGQITTDHVPPRKPTVTVFIKHVIARSPIV